MTREKQADSILYDRGLLAALKQYGTPHTVGSYRMKMMAWNDLDIDVENDAMSLEKLHKLTAFILRTFHPVWYEAKEEVTDEGKTVWFHGFETVIGGELWNVDIWFFDKETIKKAEEYCDRIAAHTSEAEKQAITRIKQELIARDLYGFDRFHSKQVYEAVTEKHILTAEEFLDVYSDKGEL